MTFFAHSIPDKDCEHWQPLGEHLRAVAAQAAQFAAPFGGSDWARLAGSWHDLGKYSAEFQAYLGATGGKDCHLEERPEIAARIDHSTAGAQHAAGHPLLAPQVRVLLAYLIAGHHAGLADGRSTEATGSDLETRLRKVVKVWQPNAPAAALAAVPLRFPLFIDPRLPRLDFAVAFFLRMVFSALTDADFLDTESVMSRDRAEARRVAQPSIGALDAAFTRFYQRRFPSPATDVQRARADVHAACLARAGDPPGLFSLEVPTGGGKTFASLAYALRHAATHGLERVIYVIPFTSIIEQNAAQFREALAEFGPDVVIEHHSNLDMDADHVTPASRLAAEAWDAPIIVTTNVQFFESLFANRPGRCRKLHRLARSVVILDEAQALPVTLLEPCLAAVGELVRAYGTTAVLCTATQPAIEARDSFRIGLPPPRPIISEPHALAARLRRTTCRHAGTLDDQTLAVRLAAAARVLCIVNTRAHARRLFEELRAAGPSDVWHLSALMCPEHRSRQLAAIRQRLGRQGPCRVVSTQLVEAGVDLDFPVVYRAIAGLDSIAQAAGRCNREGRLRNADGTPRLGEVWVFDGADRPPGFLRSAADNAAQVLALPEFAADPMSPEAVRRYFDLHYWSQQAHWDDAHVMECFGSFLQDAFLLRFATAAARFRMIDSPYEPVVIAYDERANAILTPLYRGAPVTGAVRRQLQRYTVQVPRALVLAHLHRQLVRVGEQLTVLPDPRIGYSEDLGLTLEDGTANFIV